MNNNYFKIRKFTLPPLSIIRRMLDDLEKMNPGKDTIIVECHNDGFKLRLSDGTLFVFLNEPLQEIFDEEDYDE